MAVLQLMRQENSNFQANITNQIAQQITTELAPIFTQVDKLTLQVEHQQTHAQFTEEPGMWVNPEDDDADEIGMETEEAGESGFAPVRGKRKGKGRGKTAVANGTIHANNTLNKTAGA